MRRFRRTPLEKWGWPPLFCNEKLLLPPISYKKSKVFLILLQKVSSDFFCPKCLWARRKVAWQNCQKCLLKVQRIFSEKFKKTESIKGFQIFCKFFPMDSQNAVLKTLGNLFCSNSQKKLWIEEYFPIFSSGVPMDKLNALSTALSKTFNSKSETFLLKTAKTSTSKHSFQFFSKICQLHT